MSNYLVVASLMLCLGCSTLSVNPIDPLGSAVNCELSEDDDEDPL